MAHSLHHAESSARRYGGTPKDYLSLHTWFDASKAHFALPQHRALRHHSAGIFDAEVVFGSTITNADGRDIPVRFLGEQHVKEDCRRIPSIAEWFGHIALQPWMANGRLLDPELPPEIDERLAWQEAVAHGQTILGLQDWIQDRLTQVEAAA